MNTQQGPEAEATAKAAMHLASALQMAEVATRVRQDLTRQRTQRAKAELTARCAADRLAYSRAGQRDWMSQAQVPDLARSWRAATTWA